jgi:hypothetical protein
MALVYPRMEGCADPRWDVLLWSTFLEGTEKIHMLLLVPVKARNSIDITLTRETTAYPGIRPGLPLLQATL